MRTMDPPAPLQHYTQLLSALTAAASVTGHECPNNAIQDMNPPSGSSIIHHRRYTSPASPSRSPSPSPSRSALDRPLCSALAPIRAVKRHELTAARGHPSQLRRSGPNRWRIGVDFDQVFLPFSTFDLRASRPWQVGSGAGGGAVVWMAADRRGRRGSQSKHCSRQPAVPATLRQSDWIAQRTKRPPLGGGGRGRSNHARGEQKASSCRRGGHNQPWSPRLTTAFVVSRSQLEWFRRRIRSPAAHRLGLSGGGGGDWVMQRVSEISVRFNCTICGDDRDVMHLDTKC